jgi:DNA-nicking Smr family endonuclease
MEIDLHGIKHEDVGRKLDSFIWEHMQRKTAGIKIITGNSTEMKRIVSELFKEYGFVATESFTNSASMIVDLL